MNTPNAPSIAPSYPPWIFQLSQAFPNYSMAQRLTGRDRRVDAHRARRCQGLPRSPQQLQRPAPLSALLAGAHGGVPRRFLVEFCVTGNGRGAEDMPCGLEYRESSHRSGKWMKMMEHKPFSFSNYRLKMLILQSYSEICQRLLLYFLLAMISLSDFGFGLGWWEPQN